MTTTKIIATFLAGLALAACATQEPVAGLDPAAGATIDVTAAPITYFRQGVRGQTNRAPSIDALTITFTCLRDFDGRSPKERADAATQYSVLARERATSWLVNPRIKGGWMREIKRQSVPNEGCEPQYQTLAFETVTTDQADVMRFVLENPGAMAFIAR